MEKNPQTPRPARSTATPVPPPTINSEINVQAENGEIIEMSPEVARPPMIDFKKLMAKFEKPEYKTLKDEITKELLTLKYKAQPQDVLFFLFIFSF